MEENMYLSLIILAILVLLSVLVLVCYNSLVRVEERVKEAWSDITVQLKYRADLVPNIVETVKAYAKHEKTVFSDITKARSATMSAQAGDIEQIAKADDAMTKALSRIMAVAEAYPDLKANDNFAMLQQQLQDVEDKLQASRRFYNTTAKDLNTKIRLFPTNLINNAFLHFQPHSYFELDKGETQRISQAPEVKF